MTATDEPLAEAPPIRRSLWLAIVDAALPVVLVFWTVVDRSTSGVASLAHRSSPGIAAPLY